MPIDTRAPTKVVKLNVPVPIYEHIKRQADKRFMPVASFIVQKMIDDLANEAQDHE